MSVLRTAAVLIFLGALPALALGQESQAPPAPTPAAPEAKPETPAPAAPRAPVKDDEFIPTQELSADEEVTFPVDI